MTNPLTQKEIDHQLAVGSMSLGDAFVEIVKEKVSPIPWPSSEDLHKPYPELKGWMKEVDKRFGEVKKLFDEFFADQIANDDDVYIYFGVSVTFCEDWSICVLGIDGEDCDPNNTIIEKVYEHLQVISPLMVASFGSVATPNIDRNTDT